MASAEVRPPGGHENLGHLRPCSAALAPSRPRGDGCYLEPQVVWADRRASGRVHTEEMPWAPPSLRHTRGFQDVVCYLSQRSDRTRIGRRLRVSVEAVARVIQAYVPKQLGEARLKGLLRTGFDEVSRPTGSITRTKNNAKACSS